MEQKLTYESLKAEQAWMVVSEQLQQRNSLLSMGINHLERLPGDLPVASRLMITLFLAFQIFFQHILIFANTDCF